MKKYCALSLLFVLIFHSCFPTEDALSSEPFSSSTEGDMNANTTSNNSNEEDSELLEYRDYPYIESRYWGIHDRLGSLGDLYCYSNPYNVKDQLFELVGLGSDDRYWYFPTTNTNKRFWEYKGTFRKSYYDPEGEVHIFDVQNISGNVEDIYKSKDLPYDIFLCPFFSLLNNS